MSQHEREITSYRQRQDKLRGQISALTSGKGTGDDKVEKDREATIRRTQRQIADLERAIARLRQPSLT
jgi:cell division protein FtsB